MTLITQLCVLCAMSAMMQIALPQQRAKGSMRMICGMLMLRLTVTQIAEIGAEMMQQRDLVSLFVCLTR